jgi:hypothetical protein
LTPRLRAFVEAGAPPAVITFGSMAGIDARRQTAILCEAMETASARAVVQMGWASLGEGALPPSVFRAGFVPRDWLFARATCVVHHGGAGRRRRRRGRAYRRSSCGTWATSRRGGGSCTGAGWRRDRRSTSAGSLTAGWLSGALREIEARPAIREGAVAMGARVRAEVRHGATMRTDRSAMDRPIEVLAQ